MIGLLFGLAGLGMIALALWWVYRPLCPAFGGASCLFFARMAFKEAECSKL